MEIILIHGQARTSLMMRPLGWRLKRAGFQVHYFNYICAWQSVPTIVERFVAFLRGRVHQQPYVVVGHSLGALISRLAFAQLPEMLPEHVVMVAPPNQPPYLATWAQQYHLYRLITGDCGTQLSHQPFFQNLPAPPPIPMTIIAGTRNLYRWVLPHRGKPHDGILALAETVLDRETPVITVHAGHTTIMGSTEVAAIILGLLARNSP